jgi:hypothetical protein
MSNVQSPQLLLSRDKFARMLEESRTSINAICSSTKHFRVVSKASAGGRNKCEWSSMHEFTSVVTSSGACPEFRSSGVAVECGLAGMLH